MRQTNRRWTFCVTKARDFTRSRSYGYAMRYAFNVVLNRIIPRFIAYGIDQAKRRIGIEINHRVNGGRMYALKTYGKDDELERFMESMK